MNVISLFSMKEEVTKIYNLTEMLRDRIGDVLSKQKE